MFFCLSRNFSFFFWSFYDSIDEKRQYIKRSNGIRYIECFRFFCEFIFCGKTERFGTRKKSKHLPPPHLVCLHGRTKKNALRKHFPEKKIKSVNTAQLDCKQINNLIFFFFLSFSFVDDNQTNIICDNSTPRARERRKKESGKSSATRRTKKTYMEFTVK